MEQFDCGNSESSPIEPSNTNVFDSSQFSQPIESEDISPAGEKRPPFTNKDDLNLTKSYLAVTEDPINGVDQKRDIYWVAVGHHYNSVLQSIPSRTPGSLKNRWRKFLSPAFQRISAIVGSLEAMSKSGYSQYDTWLQAKDKYYEMHKKAFQFDKCWDIAKHNPKFMANLDPYPSGTMYGAQQRKGKKKATTTDSITDLTCDGVDSVDDDDDEVGTARPMGNKRALKARREKEAGVVSIDERVSTMVSKMDEMKRAKEEEKLARQIEREEKRAVCRAQLRACEAQEEFYRNQNEREEKEREDKILFQPTEGLDERSKEYLLHLKNEIFMKRGGM